MTTEPRQPTGNEPGLSSRRQTIRVAVKALNAWESTGNPRNLQEAIAVLQAAQTDHHGRPPGGSDA